METEQKESSLSNISRFRLPLALTIVGLTLLSAGIYYTLQKNTTKEIKFTQEQTASSSAQIIVHLAGEVANPGVYTLPFGSRMNDLISRAGGFTNTASKEYINKVLNLAQILKDGAKIYIPKEDETNSSSLGVVAGEKTAGLININSASLSELDALPDIGAVRAQKILDNRPYSAIEELVEKKVITQTIFEKIKEKITIY